MTFAVATVFVSTIGLGALTLYVIKEPHAVTPPQFVKIAKPVSQPNISELTSVSYFVPKMTTQGILFSVHTAKVHQGEDPMTVAINSFLAKTNIAPPHSRLIGEQVRNGIAHLAFSADFQQTYGSFDEKMLIDGLRRNAGQFAGVKEISIEINGQPIQTLGSGDLSSPLPALTSDNDLFSNDQTSDSGPETKTDQKP